MNTNPAAIKVLCYGDSNTWGQKPDKTGRYPANVRWTGQLQQLLGDDYYVIEEGVGSRTTDLDYARKPGRNGKTYLLPCLASHNPIDCVVLMLGTNDLKTEYGRSATEIANAIAGLSDDIKKYAQNGSGAPPQVIVMSPILINSDAPRFSEFYTGYYDERATQESHKLAGEIQRVAEKYDYSFIDAAHVSHAGEDGIHFSEESNKPLCEAITNKVLSIYG